MPPGLGDFPLRHVDDFAAKVPEKWLSRGGDMRPMYQSEALCLDFSSRYLPRHRVEYPFAVNIATGKINAISGNVWTEGLDFKIQDYMVITEQPWLDGYCVEKGIIRQFVAMPLGSGYSAEEQITGQAEYGGSRFRSIPCAWSLSKSISSPRGRRYNGTSRYFVLKRIRPTPWLREGECGKRSMKILMNLMTGILSTPAVVLCI